jgi:hypothetical protein
MHSSLATMAVRESFKRVTSEPQESPRASAAPIDIDHDHSW